MTNIDPITEERLGTGRRKTAVARVRIKSGEGKVTVNGREYQEYFPNDLLQAKLFEPFEAIETEGKFDVRINVEGGGISGQAEACRHGIARALLVENPEFRPALKARGLLTRDQRQKERKKYGQPGARKRFQYSKR
jgi:small subunit ribosomal protein S9